MNFDFLSDQNVIVGVLTLVAVAGTIYTLILPFFERDNLKARMKSVALEREQIRSRERQRLSEDREKEQISLRQSPKQNLKDFVEKYNLRALLKAEGVSQRLKKAGYRGASPLYTYLTLQIVLPVTFFSITILYTSGLLQLDIPLMGHLLIALVLGFVGFYAPYIYVQNQMQKRQESIRLAWPDALDLMLICVESGVSIEVAFKKVSEEISAQSVPLSEELILANAELSFLEDRKQAYNNLAERTGLDGVKNVVVALVQAESFGTPIGQALRVLSDENRTERMQEAERKAAALPPKLTVPMMLFFMPVLFVVILGPAVIQVAEKMG